MRHGIGRLRAGGSGFSPLSLFSAGEQGVWYDPSDFSSMFQDSAGTTPVTATTQPVGLILDKRLGLALSSTNQVVNGDFSSSVGWVTGTGWTISGGVATATGVTGSFAVFRNGLAVPFNKLYKFRFTVSNYSSGSCRAYLWNSTDSFRRGFTVSANGTYEGYIGAFGTVNFTELGIEAATSFSGTVDDFSLYEVLGNHATQSTAGSRDLLQQVSGIYARQGDGLDDYIAAASGGGGTASLFYCSAFRPSAVGANQTLWADTGTNTGYRVRINASNQLELAAGNGTAFTTANTTATVSTGTTYVVTAWHDGVNLNVQLNTGTVGQAAFGTATAGTASFTSGASNGGASGFFNGYLYTEIYKKDSALTSAQRSQVQQYVAGRAGITI